MAGLQLCSHQGNDHHVSLDLWERTRRETAAAEEEGRFIAFLGCEWSADTPEGGDRNVIYRRDEPRSSDLGGIEGSARAHDFGLMAVAPAARIMERLTDRQLVLGRYLRPQLDIGYGVAWHNRGSRIAYSGVAGDDPLPANRRHGWSGSLAMDWASDSLRLTIARVTVARETYRPQIEGVQAPSRADDKKSGVEVSILETISFRRGENDDFDGEAHFKTSGRTIRSDGLFRSLAHQLESTPPGSSRDALLFVARHLSISWSWFEYDRAWPFSAHSHSYLGLSFRSRQPAVTPG